MLSLKKTCFHFPLLISEMYGDSRPSILDDWRAQNDNLQEHFCLVSGRYQPCAESGLATVRDAGTPDYQPIRSTGCSTSCKTLVSHRNVLVIQRLMEQRQKPGGVWAGHGSLVLMLSLKERLKHTDGNRSNSGWRFQRIPNSFYSLT